MINVVWPAAEFYCQKSSRRLRYKVAIVWSFLFAYRNGLQFQTNNIFPSHTCQLSFYRGHVSDRSLKRSCFGSISLTGETQYLITLQVSIDAAVLSIILDQI